MTLQFTRKSHPIFRFRRPAALLATALSGLFLLSATAPVATAQTSTMLVLRAVPAKLKKGESAKALPPLTKDDIAEIKIGGKTAPITGFDPLLKGPHTLQLMVLLDSMQMLGAGGQFDDIKKFMMDLPPNVEIGVGWLLQSQVKIVQPFTTDHVLAGKALITQTREQAANPKNDNGNPFSCLRWLASHWPNADPTKLRAVLMFTDGIIRVNSQQQDAQDQVNHDVEGASESLEHASIIPFPFFWLDPIVPDPNRSEGGSLEGQQNFSQLVSNTGGRNLSEGMFAPGSFFPLLNELYSTLNSSAVVTVTAPSKSGFKTLDIKSSRDDIKIFGPDYVQIGNVPYK